MIGRPPKLSEEEATKVRELRNKGISVDVIARTLGISRPTVYRYLNGQQCQPTPPDGGSASAEDEVALNKGGPRRRTEWNAETGEGFIETGRVGDDFHPANYDEVLLHHGLDPKQWRVTGHLGFVEWDVPFKDPVTGARHFHKAQSHRFNIEQKSWDLNLPALYAEVAATKRPTAKHRKVDGGATAVVCWADVQTGKVDHLGGVRELLERLDEKREVLHDYLSRATRVDQVVVADCGDIIEGFGNFPAQHRTNGLSLMEQVEVASTEFWKTIRLCTEFAPVDVISIPSNHCAWRREGKNLAGKSTDDWGLFINKHLEWHNDPEKADGPGLPVTFHRPPDWEETLQFELRGGERLGLAHGHQVNNPDQIKNWWAKMTHAGVLNCNILLTGHFHFASLRPVGKDPSTGRSRWHIQAPTLDNGSSWVRNKYGEDGDPALAVFQVDDDGFDVQSFGLL